jgi:pyruvate ferredoxin oxidoreductase delta subunit
MAKKKEEKMKFSIGAVISEPGSTKNYHTGTWRIFRPVILQDKCIKCSTCWKSCPDAAIKVTDKNVYYVDYTYCKGCLICFNECPVKAITKEVEEK